MIRAIRYIGQWATVGFVLPFIYIYYLNDTIVAMRSKSAAYCLFGLESVISPVSLLPLGDIISPYPKFILFGEAALLNAALYAIVGFIFWKLSRKRAAQKPH